MCILPQASRRPTRSNGSYRLPATNASGIREVGYPLNREAGLPSRLARRRSRVRRFFSFMRKGPGLSRRLRLLRFFVVLVVLFVVVSLGWSFVGAMTAPGSAPAGARVVEWISSDLPGGRPMVLTVEHVWYSWHAPPVGGTPKGGLPSAASSRPDSTGVAKGVSHLSAPSAIVPIVSDPLSGEGRWQTVGRTVGGAPAVRVAFLRPDAVHTSLVTGVMWLDTKLLQAVLVPGTRLPGRKITWPGLHFSIPPSARANLAATFNSGFLLRDSGGGWYAQGKAVVPLVDGMASFVIYKDGTATVAQWGRDAKLDASVVAVRQNLQLIVDQGQITSGVMADSFRPWGKTLGDSSMVWRSGLGVSKDGALVYAAGPGLSAGSLAEVLRRAGAVRAMELDINTEWTSAYYYSLAPGSGHVVSATKLLPNMVRSATRYLAPDERDFVAMFLRTEPNAK